MIETLAKKAKNGAKSLAQSSSVQKNRALVVLADLLLKNQDKILLANQKDLEQAKELPPDLLDRLNLQGRLIAIADDVIKVSLLPDPVGEVFDENTLANGLKIWKMRVPIGLLGVIYEARPNVTVDVAALAIKTGNGVLLRGGKETLNTNRVLVELIQEALKQSQLNPDAIQFVDSPNRALVEEMLKCDEWIDMIIPRGGAELHTFCKQHSTIPVITGGIGICHLFLDESADFEKSLKVIINAKVQRPTVCNALDTLLVHEKAAPTFLPQAIVALQKEQVELRLDPKAWNIYHQGCLKAEPQDWNKEWLKLTLGIKVVQSLDEAIEHIRKHSSGHSDGILTNDRAHGQKFIQQIDSAAVYINASTRFTDGGEFGLGAEVAISTQKLHARGPMGLKELTSYKWIVEGNYQARK